MIINNDTTYNNDTSPLSISSIMFCTLVNAATHPLMQVPYFVKKSGKKLIPS